MNMKEQLEQISSRAKQELAAVSDLAALDELRVRFLGKKGELTAILKQMGGLSADERPVMGQLANEAREQIESALSQREQQLRGAALEQQLREETIDVTMPGKRHALGHKHPLSIVLDEICDIFIGMGFCIAEGPEVEYDYYNFEALNIPKNHPARDAQDTFYITDNIQLRPQTSPVQIRTMEQQKPPIRIIAPGRVYRADTQDATHSPLFHQIEGLVVDRGITMGDLKGTLEQVAKRLYGDRAQIRFRPHHFPFTEPSAEVDVSCNICKGKGCNICKGTGWLEIMGAGMVDPNVLEACGIDSAKYTGFAFGMGVERIAMLKWQIKDLRLYFENDVRFLRQFEAV